MVFTNFVCWETENIEKILNVEATQTSDELFLATHHPIKMKKSDSIKGVSQINYTEQDFLEDFLAPNDFAFIPVLGSAGTGKSHLIRWLSANIKSTEKKKVLLIPKLGTNLKDIITQILSISDLEEEKFAEYRKRLTQAVSSLNQQEAKEQLLNQLAISVQDYPYEYEQLFKDKKWRQQTENLNLDISFIKEGLDHLKENLHYLLYDPYFRQNYWLKNQGIIEVLTSHILGSNNKLEIIEERREFTIDDIPNNVSELKNASQNARDFYSGLLGDEDLQLLTVSWLNFNLDRAIAKVLNLGGNDLQILMREVRETLAEKEIELILLIEDFAKLQGIDREVLEAVLAKPQQIGQKPLCVMRTALACTTGYFNSLMDTVQERTSFIVNLDLGIVGDVSPSEIMTMASRYLNAIRCDNETLNNWAIEFKQGESRDLPPSYCQDCQHQTTCHAGFGEVNNYGLYPFNDRALINMLKRVNREDTFKPRILIKDVLKYVLEHSLTDIRQGFFPSPSLKNHFGNVQLTALVQDDIRRKDNANAERREILIDLWTNETQLVDCSSEVHTAFNLPSLGVKISAPSVPVINKSLITTNQSNSYISSSSSLSPIDSPIQVIKTTLKESENIYQPDNDSDNKKGNIPEDLQSKINILDNWNNEGILPQNLAQDLREFT